MAKVLDTLGLDRGNLTLSFEESNKTYTLRHNTRVVCSWTTESPFGGSYAVDGVHYVIENDKIVKK